MNLFNSMVRGFGSQIGRRAANHMIDSARTKKIAPLREWLFAGVLLIGFLGLMGWAIKEGNSNKKSNPSIANSEETVNIKTSQPETYRGHTIYTGKRGGKYYYSKKGKKIYIH